MNLETKKIIELINESHPTVRFETAYTKNNAIFYKIENSNIAITKNFNYIDLTNLNLDQITLLTSEVSTELDHEEKLGLYTTILEYWIDNVSIFSKISKLSNDFLTKSIFNKDKSLVIKENENKLDVLVNKKLYLKSYFKDRTDFENLDLYPMATEGRYFDIDILHLGRRDSNTNPELTFNESILYLKDTDNNIDIFETLYRTSKTLLRAASTISLLISKYHKRFEGEDGIDRRRNEAFDEYQQQVNKISTPLSNIYNAYRSINEESLIRNFFNGLEQQLKSNLSYDGSLLKWIISSSDTNYNIIGRRAYYLAPNRLVELNIDYSSMSDEHLLLFEELVAYIVDEHASYLPKNVKEVERIILYLSWHELAGKKKTREHLFEKYNMNELNEEKERRRL